MSTHVKTNTEDILIPYENIILTSFGQIKSQQVFVFHFKEDTQRHFFFLQIV